MCNVALTAEGSVHQLPLKISGAGAYGNCHGFDLSIQS